MLPSSVDWTIGMSNANYNPLRPPAVDCAGRVRSATTSRRRAALHHARARQIQPQPVAAQGADPPAMQRQDGIDQRQRQRARRRGLEPRPGRPHHHPAGTAAGCSPGSPRSRRLRKSDRQRLPWPAREPACRSTRAAARAPSQTGSPAIIRRCAFGQARRGAPGGRLLALRRAPVRGGRRVRRSLPDQRQQIDRQAGAGAPAVRACTSSNSGCSWRSSWRLAT